MQEQILHLWYWIYITGFIGYINFINITRIHIVIYDHFKLILEKPDFKEFKFIIEVHKNAWKDASELSKMAFDPKT